MRVGLRKGSSDVLEFTGEGERSQEHLDLMS